VIDRSKEVSVSVSYSACVVCMMEQQSVKQDPSASADHHDFPGLLSTNSQWSLEESAFFQIGPA